MPIPTYLLPSDWLLCAHGLLLVVLAAALWRAPWRALYANRLLNVFLGSVTALLALWSLNVVLAPGLGFHFLGVTVFTLMFGWSLGVLGAGLVALGIAVAGGDPEAVSINALVLGVLPVSVSYGLCNWVHRRLPHHVFVYIFLCGFAAAMAAAAAAVAVQVGLLVAAEAYSLQRIGDQYLPFLALYLFPEGVLNGMLTTALIGVRPQWLKTFDDASYLRS